MEIYELYTVLFQTEKLALHCTFFLWPDFHAAGKKKKITLTKDSR